MRSVDLKKSTLADPDVSRDGVRVDPIERARRNPKSRKLAIAAKCFDCQGRHDDPGVVGRIRECRSPSCPLYPVRPYQGSRARLTAGSQHSVSVDVIDSDGGAV